MNARMTQEEGMGEEEEKEEIMRAAEEDDGVNELDLQHAGGAGQSNTAAALRGGDDGEMERSRRGSSDDKKKIRKEKLAGKLMDVFGLQEREEVLEEMRCWLLRSVSE
jgi:sterol 3beta-glucosyltransferase